MLVLKRVVGESVFIIAPPSDKPTVVEVIVINSQKRTEDGPRLRLGFEAPDSVGIYRREVLEKIASGEMPDEKMGIHPAPSPEESMRIVSEA